MNRGGIMQTRDRRWQVQVDGIGTDVIWYRLIGPGTNRALPSTQALLDALNAVGVDLAELHEVSAAA